MANSADPDQTAPKQEQSDLVCSVCSSHLSKVDLHAFRNSLYYQKKGKLSSVLCMYVFFYKIPLIIGKYCTSLRFFLLNIFLFFFLEFFSIYKTVSYRKVPYTICWNDENSNQHVQIPGSCVRVFIVPVKKNMSESEILCRLI